MPAEIVIPKSREKRRLVTIPFGDMDPEQVISLLEEQYPQNPDVKFRQRDTYAWARPARKIAGPHIQEGFDRAPQATPFVVVDLMSSTPVFRELITGQFNHEVFRLQANDLYSGVLKDLKTRNLQIEGFVENKENMFSHVRGILSKRNGVAGSLLWSAIFETLSAPPAAHMDSDVLREALLQKFHFNSHIQDLVIEPKTKREIDGRLERGAWRTYMPFSLYTTLKAELVGLIGSDAQADRWLDGVAANIAEKAKGKIRKVRVMSLDFADHNVFSTNAVHNFEEEFMGTLFFNQALSREKDHIRADIRKLPLRGESVDIVTCFEGFPFFKKLFSQADRMEIIYEIAAALKAGGKAIFFPWHMQFENSGDTENRRKLENLLTALGFTLSYEAYSREELVEDIEKDEYALTQRSQVYKEKRDVFLTLVATKPMP